LHSVHLARVVLRGRHLRRVPEFLANPWASEHLVRPR
jgi:hypothetical protein